MNKPIEILRQKINELNGRITIQELTDLNINRYYLKALADEGFIIRVGRGIYQTPDCMQDELYDLQSEYSKGIFSFETALYIHSLTERVPFNWTMTFQGNYHSQKIKMRGVEVKLSTAKLYGEGITETMSPANNPIRVYSAERTLCEILTAKAQTDIQVISYAFKEYGKKNNKDLNSLFRFAKLFHVENKIRNYLEVLL